MVYQPPSKEILIARYKNDVACEKTRIKSVLEHIKNQEKDWAVTLTGQSGMSQTGLAIFAGVDRRTLRNLVQSLESAETPLGIFDPSESLKPFIGEPLTLGIEDPYGFNGISVLAEGRIFPL